MNAKSRLSTRRIAGITAAVAASLAAVTLSVGVLSAPVSAAELVDGGITSVTTVATETGSGVEIDFDCTWSVPDFSQPGDTFTMQLPAELRWSGGVDFPLNDEAGVPVATAHADVASGLVTFTLTDYVTTHPLNVHGTCQFTSKFMASEAGDYDLEFDLGGQVSTVHVTVPGDCDDCDSPRNYPAKDMWWEDSAAQTATISQIHAPRTQVESDVTYIDEPAAGLTIDCDNVMWAAGPNGDGHNMIDVNNVDPTLVPSVDCSPAKLTVTWTALPAGTYTIVLLRADITGRQDTYVNNATVLLDGNQYLPSTKVEYHSAGGDGTGGSTTTPDTTTPDTTTPDTTTPDTTTPEVTTPEVTTPDVTTPDVTTPEVTTPDVTTPDVNLPEVIVPVTTTPASAAPATTVKQDGGATVSPTTAPANSSRPGAAPAAHVPAMTPNSKLPVTGAATKALAGAALVLIAAGAVAMVAARRRTAA